ncbi:PepSY-associated TM helix domain-containing protein [Aquamicrobium sp. LC103]|uniref:PepSY-associated TM helix domain-containing protein n=1 Tax=Aquamicrobium sp. LC103 TaxID=1120658 RepID=UPI0009E5A7B2|nr:PepSY-associated TM helix domain-containing protein [Aquamicrobium sp. LC103]TKT74909.1 PepSY domain-containing protein [Aquamicrobium sp. LC103]
MTTPVSTAAAPLPADAPISRNRTPPRTGAIAGGGSGFRAFVTRLHFYVGLFVGPFVLIAAITGTLFVITPQIEDYLYRDELRTASLGEARSLADQADAARDYIGAAPRLFAVRPATGAGWNSRVMFAEPGLKESESRAIFVDPVTLDIKGDMIVYGTSGTLPFRTQIDYLHRNLLLGEFGRYYSELAASWLWIAALGGIMLWWWRRGGMKATAGRQNTAMRTRRLHGLAGVWIAAGLIFLSITGLTWSQWAGARIDGFRAAVGWVTPSVSLALGEGDVAAHGEHAHHHHETAPEQAEAQPAAADAALLDDIHAVARRAGIDSAMIEIRPPRSADQAWLVREYDRSWPTQVDTLAIDPRSMEVVSRADFATFPIVAKLIRWGIDLHMGILFGLPNQFLMAALGLGLVFTIVYGYRIWWQRRPAPGAMPRTLVDAWMRLSAWLKAVVIIVALGLGWALPLVGASLAFFLCVDIARWWSARRMPDRRAA